jgi:hypothetical protein
MTRFILKILQPILWIAKVLFTPKARFYVPFKMNDKCYCKSEKLYKHCHFKKDKERGKTAFLVLQKNKSQDPNLQKRKYALLTEHKKRYLSKIYASDEHVKKTLGNVNYGALYIMGTSTNQNISSNPRFETDYDIAFDDGTFEIE